MKYTRLGDLLVGAGVISDEQLAETLKRQKETGKRLGETLIDDGIITERQLINALTVQLGVDFIDLTEVELDPELINYVPRSLAKKYSVVPARVRGDELSLAMADPLNFVATEEVGAASHKRIIPMIATQAAVDHAISKLYGTEGAKRAIREMQQESSEGGQQAGVLGLQANELGEEAGSQAPSIRLVNNIIERGITERASDIHIEPQDDRVRVRIRVDGILREVFSVPKELQSSLISRIKVMCNMDVTERRTPQDGRAIVRVRMKEVDLRISTLPTVNGEKIVMRLLDRETQMDTPEDLGFYGHNLKLYNELLDNNQGIVLLSGPTGSGKSSTLFTMIQHLNTDAVNIVTLEDPVEFNIAGINQVQVNDKAGTTFASGLRSILRQDPDIISIGEIRDADTANNAMRAAVTGHLVLSTVHTNDAVSVIDRLDDIGVPSYMVASALRGVIAQRLVRRICPHCKETYTPDATELELLGIDPAENPDLQFYRGTGCSECFGSGYRGRTVVAEVMRVDAKLRAAINDRAPREELMQAVRESGFVPIAVNIRDLVMRGITTTDEARRSVYVTE